MDQLFASGMKLAFDPNMSGNLEIDDKTEVLKYLTNCSSIWGFVEWAIYHKNISMLLFDIEAEYFYANGDFVGQNSKPLWCGLEDGVLFPSSRTMLMFHGDPLMRRVNDIIDSVVEAGLYNYWITLLINWGKIKYRKISIAQLIDGYYSFNLSHLQTVFYLLLMGWCLSALCFIFEVLYNRVLTKIM
jgi:hypothetical protein